MLPGSKINSDGAATPVLGQSGLPSQMHFQADSRSISANNDKRQHVEFFFPSLLT